MREQAGGGQPSAAPALRASSRVSWGQHLPSAVCASTAAACTPPRVKVRARAHSHVKLGSMPATELPVCSWISFQPCGLLGTSPTVLPDFLLYNEAHASKFHQTAFIPCKTDLQNILGVPKF